MNTKRFLAFLPLLLLSSLTMLGQDQFVYSPEVDGMYYNFHDDGTAAVTYHYSISGKGGYILVSDYSGDVVIPETVDYEGTTYLVTGIENMAFYKCTLQSLTLPNSIRSIYGLAFKECNLSALHFSSWSAWCNIDFGLDDDHNSILTKVEHVIVNGEEASLENIVIPEGTEKIGDLCFSGCSSIKKVSIPNSVTTIGYYAFEKCTGLEEIVLSDNVTELRKGAFSGCSGLTSLTIGNGLTTVPGEAFFCCKNLTSLTLPDNLKTIAAFGFASCSSLTSIELPQSVTELGTGAFAWCRSLTSVVVPEKVETLSYGVFKECESLTTAVIGDKVKEIGEDAFQNCVSLTSVTLGSAVENMGNQAFNSCPLLTEVISKCKTPNHISTNVFDQDTYRNGTLYVPEGTKELYVRFDGWRNFLNIQEMDESVPETCQLTVKDSDKGSLLFTVEGGSTFMMQIVPEGGWKVHAVTFNGDELALNEAENGAIMITTPAILENSTLNIVYESLMVDVEGVISDDASSRTTCKPVKGGVVIACEAPTVCRVYDLRGVLLREMSLTKGSTMMELPAGDTYIIDAGNKRIKVRI